MWLSEMVGSWSPRQFLLKGPCTGLLELTSSELQCWGHSLKGPRDIQGGTEFQGIRVRAKGAVFYQKNSAEAIVSFWGPCHIASSWVRYLRIHQPGYHCSPHPSDSLRACSTQTVGPSHSFQWLFHTNVLSCLMLQTFLKSLKQGVPGLSVPCTSH